MKRPLKIPLRIVIYIQDIRNITGRKRGAATKMYQAIRKTSRKKAGQLITYKDFCAYTGMAEDLVLSYLN